MEIIFILFGFFLGTILGSLLKVLADRSLVGKTFFGRSHCTFCKKTLQWFDLFPVLSYLFLKGRCRYCHKKLTKEYLLVELVTGVLIGYLFYQSFPGFPSPIFSLQSSIILLTLIFKIFFVIILLSIFLTDLKKMLVPDRIILPAIIINILYLFLFTIYKSIYLYFYLSNHPLGKYLLPPRSLYFQNEVFSFISSFFTHILSGIALGGFFLLLIILTRGKGMGGGDLKLGVFMGITLGAINTLAAVMSSFILGAIVSILLIILRKKHFGQVIPFGPFLVTGSLIALYWGDQILEWYLRLSY